jgi:hypothetical protein
MEHKKVVALVLVVVVIKILLFSRALVVLQVLALHKLTFIGALQHLQI